MKVFGGAESEFTAKTQIPSGGFKMAAVENLSIDIYIYLKYELGLASFLRSHSLQDFNLR